MYLDNSTAAKPSPQALQRALIYFSERFGSVSSPHQMGYDLMQDAQKYYSDIYTFFNVKDDDHFVFTSSGQEAVSQVFHSVKKSRFEKEGKNHFIVRAIDEAAAIYTLSELENDACITTLAPVSPHGYMTLDALKDARHVKTALFSSSLACGLTGVIQPVDELVAFAKEHDILFHLDVSHCIGKLSLDFQELDCDYLSFNGAQFHALHGTGGLFAKNSAPLYPLIHGENEEKQNRGGVLNMPLFASLAQALDDAKADEMLYCTEICRLRDMFETELTLRCPEASVLFQNEERLPHISCIAFEGIKSEALLFALNRKGVYACMGGGSFQHIAHVLSASGIAPPLSQCALSFSLSKDTQEVEIEQALVIIQDVVKRLKKTSMVYFSHDS